MKTEIRRIASLVFVLATLTAFPTYARASNLGQDAQEGSVPVQGPVTLKPASVPQEVSYLAPQNQAFCDAIATATHTAPQHPCFNLVTLHVGPTSPTPPPGLTPMSSSVGPDTPGWGYATSWVQTCSSSSFGCSTWSDKVTCSYGYDGAEVYEQSCTPDPNGGCCDSVNDSWYGCSPTPQTTVGGTMGCGSNFSVSTLGQTDSDYQRFEVDTYGNVTGPFGSCGSAFPCNRFDG